MNLVVPDITQPDNISINFGLTGSAQITLIEADIADWVLDGTWNLTMSPNSTNTGTLTQQFTTELENADTDSRFLNFLLDGLEIGIQSTISGGESKTSGFFFWRLKIEWPDDD